MKNLWIMGLAACLSGISCTSTSNFTPSADTAARTSSSNATAGSTDAGAHSVPNSAMVVEGRALTDASFLMETASHSLMQIALGRTALVKAINPEVKTFAQTIIDHHSKANTELKAIAAELGVSLPLTMMPMHQNIVDKLAKVSGENFEEKYMEEMEVVHERDVALYEVVTNGAQTVRVKAYSIRTLPLLRTHLFEAKRIEDIVD